MKNFKQHILLLLLNTIAIIGFGQAKFYAKGESVAYTGKTYVVTFVLENGDGKNFKVPQTYPGFQIVGGPNQSSSYQWINGKTASSKSYSYYLQPMKEGSFTIPKASVEVGNETLITEEFKVEIKKGAAAPQTNNRQNQRNNRNPFNQRNQQTPQENNEDWKTQVADNLFVKMYADKTNPYVGEQVNLYLKLYQRINTFNTQITAMPEFEGFWKHDYALQNTEWKKEEVDGVWYNTLLINKYALFPQREGKFTLDPLKIQTYVRLRTRGNSNSIFDQFFGSYENKVYEFQSNKLSIKAKALPLENQPKDFYGAVGNFKYSAKLDSIKAKTGNAITLKTSITGTGNIMMIDAPEISFNEENFELYDPESKEYISKKSNNINGTKKYNYQVIALKPGDYKLNPISFSYFDLRSKDYKTIYSDTLALKVTPSAAYLAQELALKEKEAEIEEQKLEFVEIAQENNYLKEGTNYKFSKSGKFTLLASSPVLLAFLLLLVKRRRDNYNPDFVALNRKKANKIALKKLKKAAVFLKAKDQKGFYNEVIRSLWDYVSLKLNIDKENLSKSNINEKLLAQDVSEELANEYSAVIENCEMAIYTPTTDVAMQEDFDRTKELIINLENVL